MFERCYEKAGMNTNSYAHMNMNENDDNKGCAVRPECCNSCCTPNACCNPCAMPNPCCAPEPCCMPHNCCNPCEVVCNQQPVMECPRENVVCRTIVHVVPQEC